MKPRDERGGLDALASLCGGAFVNATQASGAVARQASTTGSSVQPSVNVGVAQMLERRHFGPASSGVLAPSVPANSDAATMAAILSAAYRQPSTTSSSAPLQPIGSTLQTGQPQTFFPGHAAQLSQLAQQQACMQLITNASPGVGVPNSIAPTVLASASAPSAPSTGSLQQSRIQGATGSERQRQYASSGSLSSPRSTSSDCHDSILCSSSVRENVAKDSSNLGRSDSSLLSRKQGKGLQGDIVIETATDMSDSDKKDLKRAANRRSAQLSRKRKKEFMQDLYEELDDLRRKQKILQSIPDLIMAFDSAGRLRFVSPSVAAVLKCKPEDLEGTSFWKMLCEDSARLLKGAFMDALATRETGVERSPLGDGLLDVRIMDKQGGLRRVALNGNVHFTGDVPECVCSIRVTEELRISTNALPKVKERGVALSRTSSPSEGDSSKQCPRTTEEIKVEDSSCLGSNLRVIG